MNKDNARAKTRLERKRERERARHEAEIEKARQLAREAKEAHDRQMNDPAYIAKQKREAERLKEKGRKELEKQQRKKDRNKNRIRRKNGNSVKPTGSDNSSHSISRKRKNSSKSSNLAKNRFAVAIALIVAIVCAFAMFPPQDKITMGLDIQGGVSVNINASKPDGSEVTQDEMDTASKVIMNRVNSSGASAASVQQQGSTGFLVQVPGASDKSKDILDTLSSQGVLEFVDVDNGIADDKVKQLIDQGLSGMNLKTEKIEYEPFMTGESVSQTNVSRPQGSAEYAVDLQLDSQGTEAFAETSRKLVGNHGKIAILLDGVVQSAPAVQAAITNGQVQITGNYTAEEANNLKTVISSGSLPVSLEVIQSSTVGPTLGQNALQAGVVAALIGLALVILWMLLFYEGLGLLTGMSVLLMSIVYIGVLAGLSMGGLFSLTLPGIAGIIVNIGMSADSSILIMECFHEQLREGKSFKTAAVYGVKEGISTSVDADLITMVSALVLYFFAIGDVRGFGLTLAIGIACDLFVMFAFSGPIIRLLGHKAIAMHPGFWGMRDDMNEGLFVSGKLTEEEIMSASLDSRASSRDDGDDIGIGQETRETFSDRDDGDDVHDDDDLVGSDEGTGAEDVSNTDAVGADEDVCPTEPDKEEENTANTDDSEETAERIGSAEIDSSPEHGEDVTSSAREGK